MGQPNPGFPVSAPPEVYRERRRRAAAAMTRPLIVFAGHAQPRNTPPNCHYFRAGSWYLYFGGPPLENAAWLIEPGSDGDAGCTLLRRTWGVEDAVWEGDPIPDPVLAAAAGISESRIAAPDQLERLLAGTGGAKGGTTGRTGAALAPPHVQAGAWAARLGLERLTDDEARALIDLRLRKDEHELAAMRRAADITVRAHRAALAAVRPGRREADVVAAFLGAVVARAGWVSFNPIVTIRGEVFHATGYSNELPANALLLIDAGAEEPGGYASDLTRTVPVGGQWSPMQKQLYETVARANQVACDACVPGRRYREVHFIAARVICEGLVAAGLLRGDADALVARNAHTLFFPHGVGHLIGLDVHDMRDFEDVAGYAPGRTRPTEFGNKFLRLDRDLEPGYCVTVEPGLYLSRAIWSSEELTRPFADVVNRAKVDELLAANFGGIRVEHTICVRASGGPEILTAGVPTEADALAALVGAL